MSTKVFVGNLVFSTTGDELKTAFSPSAPVVSANIITRGRRSLGYGFVEFASEADAEKAVAEMDKKEIAGRPINVQIARPRDPAKEAEVREKRAAVRAAKSTRPPRGAKAEGDDAAATASATPAAATNGRRGRRGQNRDATAASFSAPAAEGAAAAANSNEGANNRGGRRGGRRNATTRGNSQPRRQREPQEQRPPSETTLFVANVPFSTDDVQLRSFFAEHNPKSAHVVRMRNGRSRGYGFVEFDTAEGQKAGLTVDGKEVSLPNGTTLKLSVKVAMTPPPVQATDAATSSAPAAESK